MMRLVVGSLILLAGLSVRASDEVKPNTLTPKEIAEGWLLLFDGETTFGWKVDGQARVVDGMLILGGNQATTASTTTAFSVPGCSFRFDAKWEGSVSPRFESFAGVPIVLRSKSGDNFTTTSTTYDRLSPDYRPPNCEPRKIIVPSGTQVSLRNVKVRPEGLKPLCNGKDLAGWREFKEPPRNKSQFSVEGGEFHIKNGPGDLQTEGQWADFALQLECRSNGKHLNSGVFFRCRPGEYQQGYEAQIHHAFADKSAKEYTLDVYDPETNQLKEKKKVQYAATDFGTGAIYRRQPARRQVAKDFEWFTMSVIANGRHISVWVNGILVTDWTDHRPLKDNAREGCRLAAGPISLQGHDPTTDLSFRNIRIAELPRK